MSLRHYESSKDWSRSAVKLFASQYSAACENQFKKKHKKSTNKVIILIHLKKIKEWWLYLPLLNH